MKKIIITKQRRKTVSSHINKNLSNILKNPEVNSRHQSRIYFLKTTEKQNIKHPTNITTRGYNYYNLDLRRITKKNIESYLIKKHQKTKQKIQVLDDGAGVGNFLGELHDKMKANGVPMESTAVCLEDNLSLTNKKKINNLVVGDASRFVIDKKYDLITSYFGSIHYLVPEVRDQVMRKYIFSLNKNGIALFRFSEFKNEPGANNLNWIKLLKKVGFSVNVKLDAKDTNTKTYIMLIKRQK